MVAKSVLFFEFPFADSVRFQTFCGAHGVRAVPVAASDCGRTIGELSGEGNFPGMTAGIGRAAGGTNPFAGRPDPSVSRPDPPAGPMMVFVGFTPDDVEGFLDDLKKENLAVSALKAFLTPVNAMWTPGKLYENLSSEHRAMNGKGRGSRR